MEKSLDHLYRTKTDLGHTHAGTDITSTVANATNASYVPFSGVTGKPTTLAGYGIIDAVTSAHTHTKSQVTDFAHTHDGSEITSIVSLASYANNSGNAVTVGGLSGTQLLRNDIGNQSITGVNSNSLLNLVSSSGKLQFYCYSDGTNYIESFNSSGGSAPLHIGGSGDGPTTINLNGTVTVSGNLVATQNQVVRSDTNQTLTASVYHEYVYNSGIMRIGGLRGATNISSVTTDGTNLVLDATNAGQIYLGYYGGTRVNFCGGTNTIKSFVDANGVFNGTATSIPTSDVGGNIWIS